MEKIEAPGARQVTSCAVDRPDLDELYMISASERLTDEQRKEQPLAGSPFRPTLNVKGVPALEFGG